MKILFRFTVNSLIRLYLMGFNLAYSLENYQGIWSSQDSTHQLEIIHHNGEYLGKYGNQQSGSLLFLEENYALFYSGQELEITFAGQCADLYFAKKNQTVEICKAIEKEEIKIPQIPTNPNPNPSGVHPNRPNPNGQPTDNQGKHFVGEEGCGKFSGVFTYVGQPWDRKVQIWEDKGVCKAEYSSPEDPGGNYKGRGVDTVRFLDENRINFHSTWDFTWKFTGGNCGQLSWPGGPGETLCR